VVAAALARGAQPTGLDIAAEMVAMARRLNPGGALRARRRRAGAVRERRLRRGHASFAILHVGRPERAAAELARVLRQRGRVALRTSALPRLMTDARACRSSVDALGPRP
jgi:hypothetical protein